MAAVETGKRWISADDIAIVRSNAPPTAIQAVKLMFGTTSGRTIR
jgi:hypothetical protein